MVLVGANGFPENQRIPPDVLQNVLKRVVERGKLLHHYADHAAPYLWCLMSTAAQVTTEMRKIKSIMNMLGSTPATLSMRLSKICRAQVLELSSTDSD